MAPVPTTKAGVRPVRLLVPAVLVLAGFLSACGGSGSPRPPTALGPNDIEVADFTFAPPTLTVTVGTNVTWGWVGSLDVPPGSTTVEVMLTRIGEETIVRLVHGGLPTESSRDEHAAGWRHYLARLTVVASGDDPGPDPLDTAPESGRSSSTAGG